MDEQTTITLEEVSANVLYDLNEARAEDKGYESLSKTADMVLKHVDEQNRREFEEAKYEADLEHQKNVLEFEKQKHADEMAQMTRQNDLKELEIKALKFGTGVTLALGLGQLGRDIWEFCKANKFEQDGIYRSLISKIATGRINKR